MFTRFSIIVGLLLCLTCGASAETPSPETLKAARSLITTMKISDQYKALLSGILLRLKPVVTQERPEIENDYDTVSAKFADAYTPFYNDMLDQAAALYASNFTADELRQIEAFYRLPAGQKLLEKWQALSQQTAQIGQDVSRKAAEDLRLRLTEALRQKGHKL